MDEDEIINKGFERIASNLYKKGDKLYVQQHDKIVETSILDDEQIKYLTSFTVYQKELKKINKGEKQESKKPENKKGEDKSAIKTTKQSQEIILRGSEKDIIRVVKARRMDLIIEASEDKKNPGKGILYYDEPKIGEEPSVALIDMITADMGHIETEVLMLEEKHHVNEITGFSIDTYCAVVRAKDTMTGGSGLGTAEEVIKWDDWTREKNPKSFALTNAIRKAERNAKERIIPVPRKVIVTLVKKMIEEHIAGKNK